MIVHAPQPGHSSKAPSPTQRAWFMCQDSYVSQPPKPASNVAVLTQGGGGSDGGTPAAAMRTGGSGEI